MTASITVTPNPALAGQTVDVDGAGFNPKVKFNLATVNDVCTEVGVSTNINRPRRDGTFKVGINVPTLKGKARIRAYQSGVVVADALVTIQ